MTTNTPPPGAADPTPGPSLTAADTPAPVKVARLGAVTWVFAALALLASVAASIVAGRPEIAAAAVSGGLLVTLAFIAYRAAKRRGPARDKRTARRRRLFLLVLAVLVVACIGSSLLLVSRKNGEGCCPNAVAVQTVDYHAEGRLDASTILLDERIVLDERSMSGLNRSTSGSFDPTVSPTITIDGWQPDGLVDGYPAFTRTQTVSWEDRSGFADAVDIPISLGELTATSSNGVRQVGLTPQTNSTVSVTVPKGSVGSAVPALASTTESLAGDHTEIITFDVGRYASSVSFDLLPGPLRNPAGRAVYEASLWGFWQWAAGAAGAVVSGLVVDKLGQGLWNSLRWMFRRRVKAGAPAST